MKFKTKERFQPYFKPFTDLANKRPCSKVKRTIAYETNRDENSKFTLGLTFTMTYLDENDVILTDCSHKTIFGIENDSADMQDHVIDLGKKLTLGDRETTLFLLRFEPNILASVGSNKDIPGMCDKIIASLTNLGFFD